MSTEILQNKITVKPSMKDSSNSIPLSSTTIPQDKSTIEKNLKHYSASSSKKNIILTSSLHEKYHTMQSAKKELDDYKKYLSTNSSGYKSKPKICSTGKKTHKKCNSEIKIKPDIELRYMILNASSKKITKQEREKMFNQTYERFNKLESERNQRIESLKKSIIEKEKKSYRTIPKINSQSKILAKTNEDFLTRQKEKDKELNEKKKHLIEEYHKKEKYIKPATKKANQSEINKTISSLYEWDQKRKEKINLEKKQIEQKTLSKIQSRPQINKKSYKIAVHKNTMLKSTQLVNRLYKEDVEKLSQKKLLLNKIYTPTFTPSINSERRYDRTKARVLSSINKTHLSDNIESILRDKIIKNRGRTASKNKMSNI